MHQSVRNYAMRVTSLQYPLTSNFHRGCSLKEHAALLQHSHLAWCVGVGVAPCATGHRACMAHQPYRESHSPSAGLR